MYSLESPRAILMSTHNIPFSIQKNHPKFFQICSDGIFSKELKNEFETAVVSESSVFEPLKFYSIYKYSQPLISRILISQEPSYIKEYI